MSTPPPPPPPGPPPPPPPPAPPAAPPPPPAPAARAQKNNTTVIIVLVIVGVFVLLIGGCAFCAYVVGKKAHDYAREAEKNPTMAALSLAASVTPDVQVVRKDLQTGKITLRNKKTGEVVTIDTNDFTPENIGKALEQVVKGQKPAIASKEETGEKEETAKTVVTASTKKAAAAEEAKAAAAEEEEKAEEPVKPAEPKISAGKAAALATTTRKFPSYLPTYPGSQTTEATMQSYGPATVGMYEFLTSDSPETVAGYYEKKFKAEGLTVAANSTGTNDNGATANIVAMTTDGQGTISVNAEAQAGGKAKVTIGFTMAKK